MTVTQYKSNLPHEKDLQYRGADGNYDIAKAMSDIFGD